MNSIETQALFDLGHTLAGAPVGPGPVPVGSAQTNQGFHSNPGRRLGPAQYEERAPGVWVARTPRCSILPIWRAPVIIGHEAEVRQCAFIRGSALVGAGAVVGNSTELKNCILFDKVQVPHFNYVGDSILGLPGPHGRRSGDFQRKER